MGVCLIDSATRGAYDIYSLLLKERIVYLGTAIEENVANLVVTQLLYLDSENHNPIMLYLNSPGGIVYGGFAIYDTMRKLKSPVSTVAMGFCGSMSEEIEELFRRDRFMNSVENLLFDLQQGPGTTGK